jgi:hypothetical protein
MPNKQISVLTMTLNSEWYDMIWSGYKFEEYRELKPFWNTRLEGRNYTEVEFINGYHKGARRMRWTIREIVKDKSKPIYGGDNELCWVIRLDKLKWFLGY